MAMEMVFSHLRKLMLCVAYILVSSLLIRFNKYLMDPQHFPFSMALTAMHMAMSMLLCSIFYMVRPSAFPAMATTEGKRMEVVKWFIPIGMAFAMALYFSNRAYTYCNVTFLQFMKEANVIITFLISCAVGLQLMNRVRLAVIVWVITGSCLAVTGEVHFVMIGFILQAASQIAECSRAVMGEWVLSGGDLKLDPLTYTLFTAPICLVVLLVGNFFAWDPLIPERAGQLWHLLIPNASLAFLLNVLVAALIKETSAVGFILTGVVKDVFVVVASAIVWREVVTPPQAVGFTITLTGIFYWSFLKASPKHPAVTGFERFLGLPPAKEDENAPIMQKP